MLGNPDCLIPGKVSAKMYPHRYRHLQISISSLCYNQKKNDVAEITWPRHAAEVMQELEKGGRISQ